MERRTRTRAGLLAASIAILVGATSCSGTDDAAPPTDLGSDVVLFEAHGNGFTVEVHADGTVITADGREPGGFVRSLPPEIDPGEPVTTTITSDQVLELVELAWELDLYDDERDAAYISDTRAEILTLSNPDVGDQVAEHEVYRDLEDDDDLTDDVITFIDRLLEL